MGLLLGIPICGLNYGWKKVRCCGIGDGHWFNEGSLIQERKIDELLKFVDDSQSIKDIIIICMSKSV